MQTESYADQIPSKQFETPVSSTENSQKPTTSFSPGNRGNTEKYSGEKPWMNEDGTPKTDHEISDLCQSWTADIWEEYLQDFEASQKEDLLSDPIRIGEISATETVHLLFSLMETKDRPHLEVAVRACLKSLSSQQKKIIEMRYWENMNFGEIARALGLKRQTVNKFHDRALAKLKDMLVSGKVISLIRIADRVVQNSQ